MKVAVLTQYPHDFELFSGAIAGYAPCWRSGCQASHHDGAIAGESRAQGFGIGDEFVPDQAASDCL